MNGKLRNMTSLYILKDDKVLLLYRQGSRVVNDTNDQPCSPVHQLITIMI